MCLDTVALSCSHSAVLFACCTAASVEAVYYNSSVGTPPVMYEWTRVVYDWSPEEEAAAIANGTFVIDNCLITGVKVDADQNVYVSVPRWRPGVPSTLNKVGTNTHVTR